MVTTCCFYGPSKVSVSVGSSFPSCSNLNASAQLEWNGSSWDGSDSFALECTGLDEFQNPILILDWTDKSSGCGAKHQLGINPQCIPLFGEGILNIHPSCCDDDKPGEDLLNLFATAGIPYPNSFPPPTPPCDPLVQCCTSNPGGNGPDGGNGPNGGNGPGTGGPGGPPPGNPPTCSLFLCRPPRRSSAPVAYGTGEFDYSVTDLSVKGYGVPWGHTRSFRPRLNRSETIGQGYNWQVTEWPYLVKRPEGSPGTEITEVIIQGDSNSSLWFDKVDGEWVPRFNVKSTLEHDTVNEVYRLTDLKGNITEFDDYTGMFSRRISPAGNTITVTGMSSNGANFTTVEREYTENSVTTTEKFEYAYQDVGDLLLSSVTLSRKVGAGAWENVSRALYTYYGNDESYGLEEDLKTATTQQWNGSVWQDTGTNYYRYYKTLSSGSSSSSSSSTGANDFAHQLKYILNKEAYNKLAADPSVSDPLTATDAQVAQYADFYYEFDLERRVTKEMIQGGSRTFSFSYEESNFDDDYNAWKTKTTETLPDGSQNIIYCNYASQPMLKVLKSGDDEWYEFFKYDDSANVILYGSSSAISGYDDQYADLLHEVSGNYQYLRDSSGLIRTYTYHAPTNWLASSSIQEGELGTSIKLLEREYISCGSENSSSSSSSSAGGMAYFLSKEISFPSDTDQTKKIITSYSYTWYEGTCQVKEITTTLPVISISQNGSGVANARKEYFDEYGNLTFTMDERGYIDQYVYDIPTGAITQQIQDVDTGSASGVPSGWTTPSGGGLNLVTDLEHDDRGRITQELGPTHTIDLEGVATEIRTATWNVYKTDSEENQLWQGQGYATGTFPSYTYTLINPVNIVKLDKNGNLLENIQAVRASTNSKLQPTDIFVQSSYESWTTNQYTECCLLESTRAYHSIPSTGSGSSGANYDQTDCGYDSMKRRNRTVTPGGTITFNVFDVRGNVIKTFVGTDDTGATNQDPTGGATAGNNMVQITGFEFDGGNAGGDNNLTKQTQYVTATNTRITLFSYDWRNRKKDTDGEIDYFQKLYYDNLDRITKTEQYDTTPAGNLIARSETKYDNLDRIYQTIRYGVNPITGAVGNSLTDNTWYDATGNVIKQLPAGSNLFTKEAYDSLGRQTIEYKGYDLDETSYTDAGSIIGDTILEQTEITYDDASNEIQTVFRQRYHDAPASQTGSLQNPGTTPKARVTYQATYPDAIGRILATSNYGTNGGISLSRSSTIPSRSDVVLVTSNLYDSAGRLHQTTDPEGKVIQTEYDARGREIQRTMNVQESSSTSSSSSSGGCPASLDINIIVSTAYSADGNISTLTANNSLTGNQTITYTYGTTLSDSEIATSILKRSETYPDSVNSSDVITFEYNRQSQISKIQDQGSTVHSYDFDKLGRQTQDRITTLGTGVDGTIRRIATTYEVRGMKENVSSYDNATVGSGSVVNEVQFAYNDFGQLITDYQSHSGAVNTSTTPKVQYSFVNGSDNTIRPTTLTYPDGRVLTNNYGTSNDVDDVISRVAALVDDDMSSTHLADYSYLGLRTFVEVDYTEPDVEYTLIGTTGGNDPNTGDIYHGLDRFGRIKDSYWYDYGSSSDVDRIQYGYDQGSNRTYRKNVIADALSKHFDELYSYDGINRLLDMERGTLNGPQDVITNLQFAECWSLDETGNWSNFRQDDTGNGMWDLNQGRTNNKANEITDITESAGSSWMTPVYCKAGNMTTVPQPADPTTSYTATYDAWNRLVKINESANTVAEYIYDGAKRRVIQKTYTGGSLSETKHLYYTEPNQWQILEERIDSSTTPKQQYVWGLEYQDALVVRDRDTTGNGTLDERFYGLQDANCNVTSIINTTGVVQERYIYDAYGKPTSLDSSFNIRTSSSFDWNTLYCGYRFEEQTALFHVRNRVFHTSLGGWIQRDPIGLAEGLNLYLYVGADPTNMIDPTGTTKIECTFRTRKGTIKKKKVVTDCQGLATECCDKVKPPGMVPWGWKIDGAQDDFSPPPPGGAQCVLRCVEAHEGWIVAGVAGDLSGGATIILQLEGKTRAPGVSLAGLDGGSKPTLGTRAARRLEGICPKLAKDAARDQNKLHLQAKSLNKWLGKSGKTATGLGRVGAVVGRVIVRGCQCITIAEAPLFVYCSNLCMNGEYY